MARTVQDDVDKVLLVGGSTNVLRIRKLLKDYFGEEKLCLKLSGEEAVARGAATLAAILSRDSSAFLVCTTL